MWVVGVDDELKKLYIIYIYNIERLYVIFFFNVNSLINPHTNTLWKFSNNINFQKNK